MLTVKVTLINCCDVLTPCWLETFHTMQNFSRMSRMFYDCLKHIQSIHIISRLSRKCPHYPKKIQAVQKDSRLSRNLAQFNLAHWNSPGSLQFPVYCLFVFFLLICLSFLFSISFSFFFVFLCLCLLSFFYLSFCLSVYLFF